MRLTRELEAVIIEQINERPTRALVLPDWCYWKNTDQPVVYITGLPIRLSRHLYEKLISPLEFSDSLTMPASVHPRNVNPHLFVLNKRRVRSTHCPNGHSYEGNEMPDNGSGWRCVICYTTRRNNAARGLMGIGDVNGAKTHCPKGHPYSGDNLIIQRDRRRRCRQCNLEQTHRYRAAFVA